MRFRRITPIGGGATISAPTNITANQTGPVCTLATGLTGVLTWTKLGSPSSPTVTVSSAGVVSLSVGVAEGATVTFGVRVSNASGDAVERVVVLTGQVIINLQALTLSASTVTKDASSTVNILGATAGSTLAIATGTLPAGMVLNSALRTLTGTPTTLGSNSFTLRETLAGANNSPRDSSLSLTVEDAPAIPAWFQSATIGSDGYTVTIVGTWPASTFASFDLDPSGTPKVTFAVTASGYDRGAGDATLNANRSRTGIVGAAMLRKPYNVAGPPTGSLTGNTILDETDLGGGLRSVKMCTSRHIYPGDSVTITFAPGWRAGLSGSGAIAVTNNSTKAVPLPSARWIQPSYTVKNSAFELSLLVAAIEAEQLSGAAGVRFVGYDGTNTYTSPWAAIGPSTEYGDNLRCWNVSVDPTGVLNPGLTTWHWEVYPWIGAVRRSGNAHNTDTLAGFFTACERPLHIFWDPAGTVLPEAHVFVDPATGSTTPAANMVYTSAAAAKAGNKAANWSVAQQALYLANRSVAALNGIAAQSRVLCNGVITLAAGSHTFGSQAVTTGATNNLARIIIQGDPTNADPRANCVLQTSASFTARSNRHIFRNMTVELGTNAFPSGVRRMVFQNVELRGKAGQETGTNPLVTSAPTAGLFDLEFYSCRYWKYGQGISGGNNRVGIVRGLEFVRNVESLVMVNVSRIVDGFTPNGSNGFVGGWSSTSDAGTATDCIFWNVSALGIDSTMQFTLPSSVTSPTNVNPSTTLRMNLVNCLFERRRNGTAGDDTPFIATAGYVQIQDSLIDGCTFVGQRCNWGYNDPIDNTTPMFSTGNCVRNSHFDRRATKHDLFSLNGLLIQGWANLYGVDHDGNTIINIISGTGNFDNEFYGLRSIRGPDAPSDWAKWTDWRAQSSTTGSEDGYGDYRPQATSPLLGIGRRSTTDRYRGGQTKSGNFAAGSEVPA